MPHLKSISVREFNSQDKDSFPFDLEIVKSLREIQFDSPVTFFVGENGSGKSTILETIACAAESITVGSESVRTDKSLAPLRKLAQYFRLAWTKRARKGFFLRAEDFFGYAKSMRQTKEEFQEELQNVKVEYKGRSKYAEALASMPYQGQLADMQRRYGDGLDSRSHGESFLTLFQSRFVPDGLYLLDEPEAALSPMRQLTFIAALKQMVLENSQFIIATHSPILLAFPDAQILQFANGAIREVKYKELEHVQLTKDFLNNPDSFLRHL
ncbi:MAG TPA: AAA family ATPase [Anaerolineales bacterium]|jgi:predicted ATPase|nr:AAA family ATPase [Anaerolineales bacterium]HQX16263.1 AAA family ATPase [Anaerolineales bacterium]